MINRKPDEDWLVIYHKGVNNGRIPDQIQGLLTSKPDRVHFLHWGKHQGTNAYRYIKNVVMAGLNTHPQTDCEMKARYYRGIPKREKMTQEAIDDMAVGEHMHHLLQAVSRSAVRGGSGASCGPCNAYIIAPKRSGIRDRLAEVFPGCKIGTWRPTKRKPKGKVAEALAIIKAFFREDPFGTLPFTLVRGELGYDASNFRRRIRQHEIFMEALEEMWVEEIATDQQRYPNAFTLNWKGIALMEKAGVGADV